MQTVRALLKNGSIKFIDNPPFLVVGKEEYFVLVTFIGKDLNAALIDGNPQQNSDIKIINLYKTGLTLKEINMLKLMQQGQTNEQIAETLEIGDGTIRNYISRIYKKLDTPNRTGALIKAIELGILD